MSKNHPTLNDAKFLNEIKDKIKGATIEVDKVNAKFKIDGSVNDMAKIIKMLALRVIKIESEYQSKLIE